MIIKILKKLKLKQLNKKYNKLHGFKELNNGLEVYFIDIYS